MERATRSELATAFSSGLEDQCHTRLHPHLGDNESEVESRVACEVALGLDFT